jgi:RNA polymerase sigma-70 factor (ECF subfamily)
MTKVLVGTCISGINTNIDTDKQLVLRSQQGDCHSFRQLYRNYQQRVRSTLYQLCGREILDDLVQEVFLRAWKGLPNLREPAHFGTWLYRISWNVATDQKRKYFKAKESLSQDEQIFNTTPSQTEDTPDLMRLHYQDLVQRGLQSLSLEHRAVLVLHDLEDIPQKEIAEILSIPIGTVKSRLFHARKAIRQYLEQEGVSL